MKANHNVKSKIMHPIEKKTQGENLLENLKQKRNDYKKQVRTL